MVGEVVYNQEQSILSIRRNMRHSYSDVHHTMIRYDIITSSSQTQKVIDGIDRNVIVLAKLDGNGTNFGPCIQQGSNFLPVNLNVGFVSPTNETGQRIRIVEFRLRHFTSLTS